MVTGRLLPTLFGEREEYVVATKVFMPTMAGENGSGLSRKHIMASIDASLSRLGMDYVDLYQIHRFDPRTPIAETMEALHDVVKAGKARYIGASSMYAWQFATAQETARRHGWTPFVSMQNHYNLIYREEEREMIPLCRHEGVGVIPWSPLARGMLTGNRTREGEKLTRRSQTDRFGDSLYTPEVDFDVIERADEVAARARVPTAQVSLAWLLARPGVTAPIVGATKLPQLAGRARRRAARARAGRDRAPRGALPAARDRRSPVGPGPLGGSPEATAVCAGPHPDIGFALTRPQRRGSTIAASIATQGRNRMAETAAAPRRQNAQLDAEGWSAGSDSSACCGPRRARSSARAGCSGR